MKKKNNAEAAGTASALFYSPRFPRPLAYGAQETVFDITFTTYDFELKLSKYPNSWYVAAEDMPTYEDYVGGLYSTETVGKNSSFTLEAAYEDSSPAPALKVIFKFGGARLEKIF